MDTRELDQLRKIAFALPEVGERVAPGGAVCFRVQNKTLCYYHDDHRGDGRASFWCRGLVGLQDELVEANPKRFFKPRTSASGAFSDWLGVFLDGPDVNWPEVTAILTDAYRTTAPRRLVAKLDDA